jgi:hypothetical protein
MRKLFPVPLLILAFACSDKMPVEPELAISTELGLAQTAARNGDAVKMVPFKAKGTVMIVGMVPECVGDAGLLSVSVEIRVRATHAGRSVIAMTNCWTPNMEEFVETETGTITAANGDLLYIHGSAEDYGTTHPFYPDGTWEFGPLHFVGGTGRFDGAEGWFDSWGTIDETGTAGTLISEGWISSVGSSK